MINDFEVTCSKGPCMLLSSLWVCRHWWCTSHHHTFSSSTEGQNRNKLCRYVPLVWFLCRSEHFNMATIANNVILLVEHQIYIVKKILCTFKFNLMKMILDGLLQKKYGFLCHSEIQYGHFSRTSFYIEPYWNLIKKKSLCWQWIKD